VEGGGSATITSGLEPTSSAVERSTSDRKQKKKAGLVPVKTMSDDFIVTTTAVFGEVFGNLQRLRVYDAAEGELLLHGLSILSRECVAFLRVLLYHNAAQVGLRPSEAARVFVQHLELNKFRARYLAPFFHPHSGALAFYARYVDTLIQLDRSQHEVASARAAYWFVLNDESQLVLRSFACTETQTSRGATQCAQAVLEKLREFQTKLSNVLENNRRKLAEAQRLQKKYNNRADILKTEKEAMRKLFAKRIEELKSGTEQQRPPHVIPVTPNTATDPIQNFNEVHREFTRLIEALLELKKKLMRAENDESIKSEDFILFEKVIFPDEFAKQTKFREYFGSVLGILHSCTQDPKCSDFSLERGRMLDDLMYTATAEVLLYYHQYLLKDQNNSAGTVGNVKNELLTKLEDAQVDPDDTVRDVLVTFNEAQPEVANVQRILQAHYEQHEKDVTLLKVWYDYLAQYLGGDRFDNETQKVAFLDGYRDFLNILNTGDALVELHSKYKAQLLAGMRTKDRTIADIMENTDELDPAIAGTDGDSTPTNEESNGWELFN
jgi:hypothetical protein